MRWWLGVSSTDTVTLTQIISVNAWVWTEDEGESSSLHTLFTVLWIRLSRESPEEETENVLINDLKLLDLIKAKLWQDTNWPCGFLLTRPAKHFAADVYDSGWLQVQLISSSADSSLSIWGTSTCRRYLTLSKQTSAYKFLFISLNLTEIWISCLTWDSRREVENTHCP